MCWSQVGRKVVWLTNQSDMCPPLFLPWICCSWYYIYLHHFLISFTAADCAAVTCPVRPGCDNAVKPPGQCCFICPGMLWLFCVWYTCTCMCILMFTWDFKFKEPVPCMPNNEKALSAKRSTDSMTYQVLYCYACTPRVNCVCIAHPHYCICAMDCASKGI